MRVEGDGAEIARVSEELFRPPATRNTLFRLLAAVDRQNAVRRQPAERLLELEIVAKLFPFLLGDFGFRANELSGPLENLPQPVAQLGPLAKVFRQNVADAEKRVCRGGDLVVGVDKIAGPRVQIGGGRIGGQNFVGQRLELPLPGERGQRLLLGLERQIEIFQPLDAVGGVDRAGQFGGQLPLAVDRPEDRLLSLGQLPQPADAGLNLADLLFLQPAGLVLAIADDERNRVAAIQQADNAFDALQRQAEAVGHGAQFDGSGRTHAQNTNRLSPGEPSAGTKRTNQ